MKGTSSISLICNNLFERGNYLLRLLVEDFFTSTTLKALWKLILNYTFIMYMCTDNAQFICRPYRYNDACCANIFYHSHRPNIFDWRGLFKIFCLLSTPFLIQRELFRYAVWKKVFLRS